MHAKDLGTLEASYKAELGTIDPAVIFNTFKSKLGQKIRDANLPGILELYENKGLLARAAAHLGLKNQMHLGEKLGRLLAEERGEKVREELAKALPKILPALPRSMSTCPDPTSQF